MKQAILDIQLNDEATFDNFYSGQNQLLIDTLRAAVLGAGEQFIYFWGGAGEGCSHLLQACCYQAWQHNLQAVYVPLRDHQQLDVAVLEGLEAMDVICLDDIQAIGQDHSWQEAIFHLYNKVNLSGARLIVAAKAAPQGGLFSLDDLATRLSWRLVLRIKPLDDQDKLAAFLFRAEQRGLVVSPAVGNFLLTRYSRNMTDLMAVLDLLDQESLQAKHRITVPFVKKILALATET